MQSKLLIGLVSLLLLAGCSAESIKVSDPETFWNLGIEQTKFGLYRVCDICPIRTPKTPYRLAYAGDMSDLNGAITPSPTNATTGMSASDEKPLVVGNSAMILTIRFPFDVAEIQPKELLKIKQFASEDWPGYKDKVLLVAGYTDSVGGKQYNTGLAKRRAENVRMVLNDLGIQDVRVESQGKCCYVDTNKTKEGRSKNRRAEVKVLDPTGENLK